MGFIYEHCFKVITIIIIKVSNCIILFAVIKIFFHRVMQPYILGLFIWHFDPRATSTQEEAYLYASGVIIVGIVTMLIFHHSNIGLMEIGMRVRIASSSLMYRKVI